MKYHLRVLVSSMLLIWLLISESLRLARNAALLRHRALPDGLPSPSCPTHRGRHRRARTMLVLMTLCTARQVPCPQVAQPTEGGPAGPQFFKQTDPGLWNCMCSQGHAPDRRECCISSNLIASRSLLQPLDVARLWLADKHPSKKLIAKKPNAGIAAEIISFAMGSNQN